MVSLTNLNSLILLSIFGMDNDLIIDQQEGYFKNEEKTGNEQQIEEVENNSIDNSSGDSQEKEDKKDVIVNINLGDSDQKLAKKVKKDKNKQIITPVGKLLCFISSNKDQLFDFQEPNVDESVLSQLDTLDLDKLYSKEESKAVNAKAAAWDRVEKTKKKLSLMKDQVKGAVLQILKNNTDITLAQNADERMALINANKAILQRLGNPRYIKGIRYILHGKNILSGFYPLYNRSKVGSNNIETKYNFLISGKYLNQKLNLFLFRDVMTKDMQKHYALTIEDEEARNQALQNKKKGKKVLENPYTLQQCLNGMLLSNISKFILDIKKSRLLYINVEKDHYYDSQRSKLFLGKSLCIGQALYKDQNDSSEFIQLDYETSKECITAKLSLMFNLMDMQRRNTVMNLERDLHVQEKLFITQTLKIIDNDIDMITRHFIDEKDIPLFSDYQNQELATIWQKQKFMLIEKQEVIRNFLKDNKNIKKTQISENGENFKVRFNKLVDNIRGTSGENWFQEEMLRIVNETKAYNHQTFKNTQELNKLEYNLNKSKNEENENALSKVVQALFGGGIVGMIGGVVENQMGGDDMNDSTKEEISNAIASGKKVIREETKITNADGSVQDVVKITESGPDLSNQMLGEVEG